jgi:hypothetical protein
VVRADEVPEAVGDPVPLGRFEAAQAMGVVSEDQGRARPRRRPEGLQEVGFGVGDVLSARVDAHQDRVHLPRQASDLLGGPVGIEGRHARPPVESEHRAAGRVGVGQKSDGPAAEIKPDRGRPRTRSEKAGRRDPQVFQGGGSAARGRPAPVEDVVVCQGHADDAKDLQGFECGRVRAEERLVGPRLASFGDNRLQIAYQTERVAQELIRELPEPTGGPLALDSVQDCVGESQIASHGEARKDHRESNLPLRSDRTTREWRAAPMKDAIIGAPGTRINLGPPSLARASLGS